MMILVLSNASVKTTRYFKDRPRSQCGDVLCDRGGCAIRQVFCFTFDGLDNLGDALTYGLSLYVVSKSYTAKAKVALFKGGLIFLAACGVAVQIVTKLVDPTVPLFEVMGAFSLIGLVANSLCLFLLWRHRKEDVNMSSVWECSRNDIATNLSVLITAGVVWFTGSGWPY